MSLKKEERAALSAGLEKAPPPSGWRFEDLYPGVLSFSKGEIPAEDGGFFDAVTVTCEPDAESPGAISVQASTGDGVSLDELAAEVPYEKPLTPAKLVKLVSLFLKKAERYLPST